MLHVVEERLAPGLWIAGRYCLDRPVGEGGMGSVWAAHDRDGRTFALKVVREDKSANPKAHERLVREARAATSIRHPNVAPVLEVVETASGTPCLVMPLLEGESLRARLSRVGVLPFDECARIFGGVLAGLGAAHRGGIVHRDVKPENVFLDGANVLVLDFGIAKETGLGPNSETVPPSLTSTGAVLGTPHYMAPEQIFGDKDVDARADVWALGVMLFECLAGVRPTQAESLGQVLKLITTETLPSLAEVAPHVPRRISDLVSAMLSKRREARPSLDDVGRELLELAQRGGPPAPRPPLVPPTPPGVSPYGTTAPFVATAHKDAPTTLPPHAARTSGASLFVLGALLLGGGGLAAAGGLFAYVRFAPPSSPNEPVHGPVEHASTSPTSSGSTTTPPKATASAALAKPSAKPSAPKPPALPSPRPSAAVKRHATFDSGSGKMYGMGPESPRLTGAVHASLPSLQPCFPTSTDEAIWASWIRFYWPKGGGRTAQITMVKNGQGQVGDGESIPIKECIQKKVDAFVVPDATGQADIDGGASYLFASAGYYWHYD
jgi:serine/threonine protein kinase